jgi:hypothetical protein
MAAVTIALAYYVREVITAIKCFIVQATGVNIKNIFVYFLNDNHEK